LRQRHGVDHNRNIGDSVNAPTEAHPEGADELQDGAAGRIPLHMGCDHNSRASK